MPSPASSAAAKPPSPPACPTGCACPNRLRAPVPSAHLQWQDRGLSPQPERTNEASPYPLPKADPSELGLNPEKIRLLEALIESHIAEGRYPGAQVAIARNGRLAFTRTFGHAKVEPDKITAKDDTLWLMFSNTKVLTLSGIWALVEDGVLSFDDPVAMHLPEFAANGKGAITLFQVATHQGGFPSANTSRESWTDHERMRAEVCNFSLEWTPGSRIFYHPRAAHLTLAMVIEAATGQDYRTYIRDRVLAPLGLGDDVFMGVPAGEQSRCADIHRPAGANEPEDNSAALRAAGLPGSGGFGTARGMAAFYQMLAAGGRLNGIRIFSPRTVAFVTSDFTGERVDEGMAGIPMHRGLGPHSRGTGPRIRGLGGLANPRTFGHGGVGSSYCWADPTSGVSLAYLTNFVYPDPWHSARLDRVSNLVHAAIE
jgi:CubicO group peptidase (beta-lactamase class C family)